jgi:hypothetical protein
MDERGERFHFVVPFLRNDQAQVLDPGRDVDTNWQDFIDGSLIWSLQTYRVLSQRNLAVSCSQSFDPRAINIGHSPEMSTMPAREDVFLISCQADYDRHGWANLHIVQNKGQASGDSHWMPLWPQPGLVQRDPSRQGVRCVAYAGRAEFLAGGADPWRREIEKLGCEFRVLGPTNWHDRSQVDVTLAVRSFGREPHVRKPPSKLIDSWHARIPFVGGYESAFSQVGEPGIDYLRVESLDAGVEAIRQLRDDPIMYRRLVDNGLAKATRFTRDAVAQRWTDYLYSMALPRYRQWLERGRSYSVRWGLRVVTFKAYRAIRKTGKSALSRICKQ